MRWSGKRWEKKKIVKGVCVSLCIIKLYWNWKERKAWQRDNTTPSLCLHVFSIFAADQPTISFSFPSLSPSLSTYACLLPSLKRKIKLPKYYLLAKFIKKFKTKRINFRFKKQIANYSDTALFNRTKKSETLIIINYFNG